MVESVEYTRQLVDYVSQLGFQAIPDSAKEDCKKLILDTLGVALRGSRTKHGGIVADFVNEFGEKRQSSVIGYGYKTSCLNAAFANAVMAHAIDFDDTYQRGIIHVGCVCIPVALAIGEAEGISGKDLITAIVGGYDVSCRVALSVPTHHTPLGFHTTGTANCFGAAAVAGKILKLSRDELRNAFGIAGTQAAGLRQFNRDGTMTKHFHAGKAAQNGILAALLAQRGFTGPPRILEGEWGFCRVLSGNNYKLAKLTEGLGREFAVSETAIKPYPSCLATHPSIDAALGLQRTYDLEPRQMERLILRAHDITFIGHNKPSPKTWLQAKLSQQYCIATALVKRGAISVDDFSPEKLKDEKVRELMGKIEVVEDAGLTKIRRETGRWPVELEIVMKSGETFTRRVEEPLGSPANPISSSELTNKFKELASSVLSQMQVEELLNSIRKLEEIGDVRELVSCCIKKFRR